MNKTATYLVVLGLVTLVAAGGSIYYLTDLAAHSGGPAAVEFPAMEKTMAGDYAQISRNMVDHDTFSQATTSPVTPDAWRTPGYPAFLVPFYVVFGSFYPALIAQVVILFLTVVLIFTMTRTLVGDKWALGLSVVYLLLPDTLLSVASLLTENVFVFVLVLATYLAFFSPWKERYLTWALTGLLLAVTAYIRPASLYIVPFFIFGYLALYVPWRTLGKRQVIGMALLAIVFAGALLPWYYRNFVVFDHFSFASTGAFVLFRQNAVQFYEAYNDVPNLEARYILLERAGFPPGSVPQDFESADALMKVAVEVISEHPIAYGLFHLTTAIPFFTSSGAQNYWFFTQTLVPTFNPEPEPSLIQALHPFSLTTLIVVIKNHGWTLVENAFWALVTLLVLVSLFWSKDVRLARMFFVIMIYFWLVTGPISHARYRIPVEPMMLMSAASALVVGVEFLQNRRKSEVTKP